VHSAPTYDKMAWMVREDTLAGRLRRVLFNLAAPLLMAPMLVFCPGLTSPAHSQGDPFAWFEQFFRAPPSRVAKPSSEFHRRGAPPEWGRRRSNYWAAERPMRRHPERGKEREAEKTPDQHPAAAPSFFVAVLGDSLGAMLAQGLNEAFENRPEVAIVHKAKENSGLVRDDFYDWVKATQDMLASDEKIDLAVMLIGSNDRQALHDVSGTFEPGSPEWQAAYEQRIEAIAAMFREKNIPLIWVGLPIFKSPHLSADAVNFNKIYRASAEKAGATFIDLWEAFGDESGQYSVFGPDINGQTVKLRSVDGVHFTRAGARKLAHFVEPDIRRRLDEVLPKPTPDVVVPSPATQANGPGEEATPADVSALPEQPVPPAEKPAAGPVLSLTSPPSAAGAELAKTSVGPPAAKNEARNLVDQTLRQGKPLVPKPGRADDFSWPRP